MAAAASAGPVSGLRRAQDNHPFRMTSQRYRHLGVALAAGAAGLAINLMPLGIASLIWPGRIVTLPVAILFGPWFGAIAALIGAAPYSASLR